MLLVLSKVKRMTKNRRKKYWTNDWVTRFLCFSISNWHKTKSSWNNLLLLKKVKQFLSALCRSRMWKNSFHSFFFFSFNFLFLVLYIDAYATAKHLFQSASYPVPLIEIVSHNGNFSRHEFWIEKEMNVFLFRSSRSSIEQRYIRLYSIASLSHCFRITQSKNTKRFSIERLKLSLRFFRIPFAQQSNESVLIKKNFQLFVFSLSKVKKIWQSKSPIVGVSREKKCLCSTFFYQLKWFSNEIKIFGNEFVSHNLKTSRKNQK